MATLDGLNILWTLSPVRLAHHISYSELSNSICADKNFQQLTDQRYKTSEDVIFSLLNARNISRY